MMFPGAFRSSVWASLLAGAAIVNAFRLRAGAAGSLEHEVGAAGVLEHESGTFGKTWNAKKVLNQPRADCHSSPLFPGADYFSMVYELLNLAKAGSEVIFLGWTFDIDTKLLGATRDDSKLFDVVKLAADRGASVFFQFWTNGLSHRRNSTLGMGWNVEDQAKRLKSSHENVHALIDGGLVVNYKWDTHIKTVVFDRTVALVGGIDISDDRWDTKEHLLPDENRLKREGMTGYGEPWQDVAVIVDGAVAADVGALAYHRQKSFCSQLKVPFFNRQSLNYKCGTKLPDKFTAPVGYLTPYTATAAPLKVLAVKADTCRAVISGFHGNLGLRWTARQIHDTYVEAIKNSKSYIYIENQYFISRGVREKNPWKILDVPILGHLLFKHPRNGILNALYDRLKVAIDSCDPTFSVVVVAPLSPFEGMLTYLNWRFFFHPKQGLVPNLEKHLEKARCTLPLTNFFSYNFLGKMVPVSDTNSVWYTTFVHSKTMVIDDNFASVGSANINDRSLWGRDGELNINIEGDGAARMRKALFSPHLGSVFEARADEAVSGPERSSLAKVFDAAGSQNVMVARDVLGLDFTTGKYTETGEPILDLKSDTWLKLAIGGAWIPRPVPAPKQESLAGQVFKHDPVLWGDGSDLKSKLTDLSNAFL